MWFCSCGCLVYFGGFFVVWGFSVCFCLLVLSEEELLLASLACRLLFWSSDGTVSSIHRLSLSGSDVRSVLRTTEKIKAMSLDLVDRRLYWIQHDHGKDISHIGSCDYDGGAIRLLKNSVRWVFLSLSERKGSFPGDAWKLSSSFSLSFCQFITKEDV